MHNDRGAFHATGAISGFLSAGRLHAHVSCVAPLVRVDGNQLWWPDDAGNNMFNSFGNIAIDPEAADREDCDNA
jgi:hypothetical protein